MCFLGKPAKKKKKILISLKLGPKQKEKLVLDWVRKAQNLKNILISRRKATFSPYIFRRFPF